MAVGSGRRPRLKVMKRSITNTEKSIGIGNTIDSVTSFFETGVAA